MRENNANARQNNAHIPEYRPVFTHSAPHTDLPVIVSEWRLTRGGQKIGFYTINRDLEKFPLKLGFGNERTFKRVPTRPIFTIH